MLKLLCPTPQPDPHARRKHVKLELRPHFSEPTPYLEVEPTKRVSDDAKPFSLFNTGRFYHPDES